MNKLPVGQTIRFAYAFTFGEIGTVLGLIWIPTVLNAVGGFLVFGLAPAAATDGSPGPQFGLLMLYFVVAFLLAAMMAVAVTQQALGLRKGPALAHFALGSAEMRVFGGFFGLYLIFFLFVLAFALVGGVMVAAGGGLLAVGGSAMGLAAVLGFAGFCILVYVFVRLSFLFIPAAIVEGQFGLTRSWELTAGNFWRIFAVGLAVLTPLLLVQGIAEYFILGPGYFASIAAMARDGANAANAANTARYSIEQAQIVQARLPLLLGMGLILAPLMQGLLFSPAAFAYRVLSTKASVESKE
jgi:hypothetical protein